jgi:hypothetical protein
MNETSHEYAITTDVESRGVGALFGSLMSHSEVLGRITADGARPQAYRGEVHRNGVVNHSRVDYAADGTVASEATLPAEARVPVTPILMRATVDQLTAFFMVERRLANRGSCALVVSVYDGRRRYNLHFTDAAFAAPPAIADRSVVGAIQSCRMRREAIAGFRDDRGRTRGPMRESFGTRGCRVI